MYSQTTPHPPRARWDLARSPEPAPEGLGTYDQVVGSWLFLASKEAKSNGKNPTGKANGSAETVGSVGSLDEGHSLLRQRTPESPRSSRRNKPAHAHGRRPIQTGCYGRGSRWSRFFHR